MLVFAKVAELGGISAAAKVLDIPKSKVSRRMAALEHSLGVRLLERSTRSVNVTEVGRIYYQHCKRMEEEANHALESVNDMRDTPRGYLRVSASVATGQNMIAPHLSEFIKKYPEITVDIKLTNRRVDVIGEGYDLAMRIGQLADSSLVSRRLGSSRIMLYASPTYLKGAPQLDELSDLTSHSVLVMSDAFHSDKIILEDDNGQQQSVDITPRALINDLTMLSEVAQGGVGIVAIPEYLSEPSVKEGRLKRVLSDWSSPEFSFYAIYPSRQGLTRKVRVWIDFFLEKLQ